MLARTASWTTTGLICLVFGVLLVTTPPQSSSTLFNGSPGMRILQGVALMLIGGALSGFVWYRNLKADGLRPDTIGRTKGN